MKLLNLGSHLPRWRRLVVALSAAFSVCVELAFAAEVPSHPNIVVIFIDDLGYGDIGPFGAQGYKTPNLDRMAAEGRRFTDFHTSSAVCSASRVALLTGCYHERVSIVGALRPNSPVGINDDELTLAELCKQQGYATAIFGKWHLGDRRRFLPLQHGFDEYYGLPYSNDMWPRGPRGEELPEGAAKRDTPKLRMFDGNKVVDEEVTGEDQVHLTQDYTRRAVSFIDRHRDQPFFLYVPHSMVHVPLYVSKEFEGKSGAGMFGDVMMEVDWSVGQILEALRRNGLDDKTLVVFTSDNGPWLNYGNHAGSAGPLREGKGTMFEGGYRVPCVMRFPGQIPPASECDKLTGTIDLLPTVAKLLNVELPAERTIDGKDIWPLMTGGADATSPHEYYYCYYDHELRGIRDERWKLMLPHQSRTLAGRPAGRDGYPAQYDTAKVGLELYDLDADVSESKNIADQHPEEVARLSAAADAARTDLGDSLTGREGKNIRPPGRVRQGQRRAAERSPAKSRQSRPR